MSRPKSFTIFIITVMLTAYIPVSSIAMTTKEEITTISDVSKPEINVDVQSDLKKSGKVLLYFESFDAKAEAIPFLKSNNWNILYDFSLVPMLTVVEQSYSMEELTAIGVEKVIPSYYATTAMDSHIRSLKEEREGMTLEDTAIQTNIYKLWEQNLTGTDQYWTIVDSGVDDSLISFKDLDNLTRSRVHGFAISSLLADPTEGTRDKSGHGTHVAGIAAGNGYYRNRKGELELFKSQGMAPDVEINAIKVLDKNGYGDTASVLEGLEMAIQMNSSVISMSFGTQLYEGIEDPHIALINEAKKKDILMVAAVGNDGWFGGSTIGLPAALPDVLAVGAVKDRFYSSDPYFIPWEGSSRSPGIPMRFGIKPDVLAPGVNIFSVNVTTAEPNLRSGTSMAVPHVSAGAVLLRQAFPQATAEEIKYAIVAGAKDIYAPAEIQGRGMVDFYRSYLILNGTLETKGEQKTVVTPVAIHDGTDRAVTGKPFRKPNLYYTNSIVGNVKTFNLTLFTKENLTLNPKVVNYFGSAIITLPEEVNVTQGVNYIPMTVELNSTSIEYNWAEVYFIDNLTGNIMDFSNVTYFSLSRFSRGNVLFDLSKDQDTPTGYFANDGPRGKYLKLGSMLESEGFIVKENRKKLTEDLLNDVDILVISDPELSYDSDERTQIRKFVSEKGKGLLILGNGGFMRAEGRSFAPFNYETLNNILKFSGGVDSGIQFDLNVDVNSPYAADFRVVPGGNVIRTRNDQSVLPKGQAFEFYGPRLKIDYRYASLIADYRGIPVVVSSEVGKGRILVFSSNLGFDSFALEYGRYSGSDTSDAAKVAVGSFNWLIEQNEYKVTYEIGGINYERLEEVELNLYEVVRINLLAPEKIDGTVAHGLPDVAEGYIMYMGSAFEDKRIEFIRDSDNPNIFYTNVQLNEHGKYVLMLKMDTADGIIYSRLDLSVNLKFFEDQDVFNLTARVVFLTLVASWVIWLRNEGGRELRKYRIEQRKKKKT